MVVPGGFEPPSPGPKPGMMDHYTTGLRGDDGVHVLLKLTGQTSDSIKGSRSALATCVSDGHSSWHS